MNIAKLIRQIDEVLTGTWPVPGQYAMECPHSWLDNAPISAPPPTTKKENVYLRNEQTNEYGFRDRDFDNASGNTSREGSVQHLTDFDAGLIERRFGVTSKGSPRKIKPEEWARFQDCKVLWHQGLSTQDASDILVSRGFAASVSYVEKAFGTYSTALENEQSFANGFQK